MPASHDTAEKTLITLRHLRLRSGLTIDETHRKMLECDAGGPKNATIVPRMEQHGNSNIRTLRAFAHAVSATMDEVEQANRNSKDHGALCHGRRGRRKKTVPIVITNQ